MVSSPNDQTHSTGSVSELAKLLRAQNAAQVGADNERDEKELVHQTSACHQSNHIGVFQRPWRHHRTNVREVAPREKERSVGHDENDEASEHGSHSGRHLPLLVHVLGQAI